MQVSHSTFLFRTLSLVALGLVAACGGGSDGGDPTATSAYQAWDGSTMDVLVVSDSSAQELGSFSEAFKDQLPATGSYRFGLVENLPASEFSNLTGSLSDEKIAELKSRGFFRPDAALTVVFSHEGTVSSLKALQARLSQIKGSLPVFYRGLQDMEEEIAGSETSASSLKDLGLGELFRNLSSMLSGNNSSLYSQEMGCSFEGTWSYNDQGPSNDFAVTCRNGRVTGFCGAAIVSRGFHYGNYACELGQDLVPGKPICNFDGTWSYNDDGSANDFAVSCRNGHMSGFCGATPTSRGFHPGTYSCEYGVPDSERPTCNYRGTWSYNDEGAANDFAVVCDGNQVRDFCGQPPVQRGRSSVLYSCRRSEDEGAPATTTTTTLAPEPEPTTTTTSTTTTTTTSTTTTTTTLAPEPEPTTTTSTTLPPVISTTTTTLADPVTPGVTTTTLPVIPPIIEEPPSCPAFDCEGVGI